MAPKRPGKSLISTAALARHLGLSRWTISRVLNGHPEVKPETSERVRKAVEELGFVPSPWGRALRGASTGMIGICFQMIGLPIISRKVAMLQHVLRTAGFRALLEVTDGTPQLELAVVRHFLAMRVDGLVMVGGACGENVAKITALVSEHALPTVLIDPLERVPLPTVELDREAGIRALFDHLYDLGHRTYALLGIDATIPWGGIRCNALRAIVAEKGLSWDRSIRTYSLAHQPELGYAYGRHLAEMYLQEHARPTAILGINDHVAIGAMTRLQDAGVAVPDEVSIAGFDNLEVSGHIRPTLTSVDQHIEEIMQMAVSMLVHQTGGNHPGEPGHFRIKPALIQRQSTSTLCACPSVIPPPLAR